MWNIYQWVKIIHIAFVVAWMAVLLYLPRIFVYHATVENSSETSDIFKLMEKKLYYFIGHTSALLVWASGLYMASVLGIYGWLILKFVFVILLTIYHINLGKYLINFSNNNNQKTSKFFRLINEIPFLIMFVILFFVVIKPEFNF
tara:strand:+ start:577 stop:1011 length:435 start_codon:yes stop_codon:yes gene_type:complete